MSYPVHSTISFLTSCYATGPLPDSLRARRADIALDRGSNDVLQARRMRSKDPTSFSLELGSISSRLALLQTEDLPADWSSSVHAAP
jgi:hypothetical protein